MREPERADEELEKKWERKNGEGDREADEEGDERGGADECRKFHECSLLTRFVQFVGTSPAVRKDRPGNPQILDQDWTRDWTRDSCYLELMTSLPTQARSAAGTEMDPSACWLFSRTAIRARLIARAVPFRVWTKRVPFSPFVL